MQVSLKRRTGSVSRPCRILLLGCLTAGMLSLMGQSNKCR